MEKQRLGTNEPEELAKIEADLKRKKEDYRAVVERLEKHPQSPPGSYGCQGVPI